MPASEQQVVSRYYGKLYVNKPKNTGIRKRLDKCGCLLSLLIDNCCYKVRAYTVRAIALVTKKSGRHIEIQIAGASFSPYPLLETWLLDIGT